MVWYAHLFQNFPQFVVIHTVKGFGIVNKAEIDVFLELSCFFNGPANVGSLISASSALSKTSLNIWKFTVHVLLRPGLRILSITLLACEMSAIVRYFLFKKIGDTKGTYHAKMGSIKDRNGMDLTEAEDIKKRWQEYTDEQYKKHLHDPENHDGIITHIEPDILECESQVGLRKHHYKQS